MVFCLFYLVSKHIQNLNLFRSKSNTYKLGISNKFDCVLVMWINIFVFKYIWYCMHFMLLHWLMSLPRGFDITVCFLLILIHLILIHIDWLIDCCYFHNEWVNRKIHWMVQEWYFLFFLRNVWESGLHHQKMIGVITLELIFILHRPLHHHLIHLLQPLFHHHHYKKNHIFKNLKSIKKCENKDFSKCSEISSSILKYWNLPQS